VSDFGKDKIGGGGPNKGLGIAVMMGDVIGEGFLDFVHL
jgi:hypothetical protein